MLKIKVFFAVIILIICSNKINAQTNFSAGAYVGGGYISGNSPNIGSFNTSIFIEFKTPLSDFIFTRLSFIYGQDVDKLFGTRRDYFPFLKGISIKGMLYQNLSDDFYLEEGFGLLYLNDRIFSNSVDNDFGVLFSLSGGIDLRKNKPNGFRLGAGTEYGLTFNNTLANYLSVYIQAQYYF